MGESPRIIAYYLPQFHPIPENDEWWGKGFTEWMNVGKAKSLFPGHQQPKLPGELGYYDLRVPETRQAQADLAKEYGVEGFCYWHYWFGNGKKLLERPFEEVLNSGQPNFPFCLAWANESWKGFWHGLKDRQTLIEQTYPGDQDIIDHFYALLPAFKDKRYIRVEGKPLFKIYRSNLLPDIRHFIDMWQSLAKKNGLQGIYFVGHAEMTLLSSQITSSEEMISNGFDAVNTVGFNLYKSHKKPFGLAIKSKLLKYFYGVQNVGYYQDAIKYFITDYDSKSYIFPTVIPNWDHSPRTKKEGFILHGSTPELFEEHLKVVKDAIASKDREHNLVFIKSWNEWGEGNYMEPDLIYGRKYLETLKKVLVNSE